MNSSLKALVMMQLKDKVDMSFLSSTKKIITKIILNVLAFVLITLGIYFLLSLAKALNIFSLLGIVPSSVIVVIFTLMTILSTIVCSFALMKNFFFSKDNQVLLTLPVTTNNLFTSKLIVYYIYELIKNLFFLLPLFLAYGIVSDLPFYYYIWMPLCLFIVSAIPICIGSVISILLMFVSLLFKNYPITKIITFIISLSLIIYLIVALIGMIPENLNIIGAWSYLYWDVQDFLTRFCEIFYPLAMIVDMIVGYRSGLTLVMFNIDSFITFVSLIAFIGVMFTIAYLIAKPIFCKMAAKPFEYKKKTIQKTFVNKRHNDFLSMLHTENKLLARTSEDSISLLTVAISMPILILLLNSLYAALSTRLLGDIMIVCFNVLIILLISLASNCKIASVFSREGAASYLIKTRPIDYQKSLIVKFLTHSIVMTISIIASIIVFKGFNDLSGVNTLFMFLTILYIYISHLLWSATMDIMNPQFAQYATTGNHISNPNEIKSSVAMFALSFIIFGLGLFFCMENSANGWMKVSTFALLFMLFMIWLYYNKIKYFYKEK